MGSKTDLHTQPIDKPLRNSHNHHCTPNDLFCKLWNRAKHSMVVKVKNRSIESSKMNLLIVAYEFSAFPNTH